MADDSLLYKGVPFGGMPTNFNPYAGVGRELDKADAKKKEKEARMMKLATMVEQADTSSMFGRHSAVAGAWADGLNKSLPDASSSVESMVKWIGSASSLSRYIDAKQQYKKVNFGSKDDDPTDPSYMGSVKRAQAGENVFEDKDQREVSRDFNSVLDGLDANPYNISFDQNELVPMVMESEGGDFVNALQWQDPENPFMYELEENLLRDSGYDWYSQQSQTLKKVHKTADGAYNYAINEAMANRTILRGLLQAHKEKTKSEKSLEELANTDGLAEQLIKDFANDAKSAWMDLFDDGTTAEEEKIIDFESMINFEDEGIEGQSTVSGFLDFISGDERPSDVGEQALAFGFSETAKTESLGFDVLYQLNSGENKDGKYYITSNEVGDLGENEIIDAINVDASGYIHVRKKTAIQDTNDYGEPIGDPRTERSFEVYKPEDGAIFESIKNHITKEAYGKMFRESSEKAIRDRKNRLMSNIQKGEALELVTKAEREGRLEKSKNELLSKKLDDLTSTRYNYTEVGARSSRTKPVSPDKLKRAVDELTSEGIPAETLIKTLEEGTWVDNLIGSGYNDEVGKTLVGGLQRARGGKSPLDEQIDILKGAILGPVLPTIPTDKAINDIQEDDAIPPAVTDVATTELETANTEINPNESKAENATNILLSKFGVDETEIQDVIFEAFDNILDGDSTQRKNTIGTGDIAKVAWCAAFVGNTLKLANVDISELGDDVIVAKAYGRLGTKVNFNKRSGDFSEVKVGDIVTMNRLGGRDSDSVGHVGFFAGMTEDGRMLVLGGNQNNQVNITAYPVDGIQRIRRVDMSQGGFEEIERVTNEIDLTKVPTAGSQS